MKNSYLLPLFVAVIACGKPEPKLPPPNILWITHEDLSPIYGCYGDPYASTPNIDALAQSGYLFTRAFSHAPICAPARSTLITGMYAPSLGTQHLRSEIPVPADLKILPEILREAGYYTTNNVKTDYNFSHEGRWDESSKDAHWRNRPEGKPFFSVFNFMITHEGPTNRMRSEDTESLKVFHDPARAQVPPYLPASPRMKEIWAHLYDLLSVFDQNVGELLAQLEADGLRENTLIFVFSDHGHGLPGHKRWLDQAGLQVPFVLYAPEKYKHLVSNLTAPKTDQMVGFVDFAPTVLTLAGAPIPERMEGRNFLGPGAMPKAHIYGYRDRADDCYDVARSVFDGRYLYVRHFMPQLPYFQDAVIFNKGGSYAEIHRVRQEGLLPEGTRRMFDRKPAEQLFDLAEDPWEQNNLIDQAPLAAVAENLRGKVTDWILDHHDTGMLNEGEMMQRAAKDQTSVYEMARNFSREQFAEIVRAAQRVGKIQDPVELVPGLQAASSPVRYWALVAIDAFEGDISGVDSYLTALLRDASPAVAGKAAEIRVKRYNDPAALRVLEDLLKGEDEPMVLQAAISLRQLGKHAKPLIPAIQQEIMPRYAGDIWGRYRSWSYPMFIGMALDQAQINCGVAIQVQP